jgi:hypothetical protein
MSTRRTVYVEDEFRDQDLLVTVHKILTHGHTGQIILNCSQGRVTSVVKREKTVERENANGQSQNSLDSIAVTD